VGEGGREKRKKGGREGVKKAIPSVDLRSLGNKESLDIFWQGLRKVILVATM
jgi:hypothetical protein